MTAIRVDTAPGVVVDGYDDEDERPVTHDDEIQGLVTQLAQEAMNYNEEYLQPFREEANRYYQGKPFGNEEKGRSEFIVPEVRDKILQVMPAMMRVFAGGERVVRFAGHDEQDDACAMQKTDYVDYIFNVDNPGFLILYKWLKDGFKNRLGIVKSWYEDKETIETSEHTDLSEDQLLQLMTDEDVDTAKSKVTKHPPDEMGQQLFSATVVRHTQAGRVHIRNVPGSEFIYSPNADDLNEAVLVGQIQDLRRSQLVALGYSADELEEYDAFNTGVATTEEQERRIEGPYGDEDSGAEEQLDPLLAYGELYVQIPNEDGIAELTKVCTLGTQFEIVRQESVDFQPFSVFCPDPEPHEVQGLSYTDYTRDIQRAKSETARGMMDSLALSLDPDLEVDENNVDLRDVMSLERPRIIRSRKMGSVREIKYTFAGEALQFLAWLDQVSEARTGSPKASTELSANILQSTTKEGVAATVSGSRERQELIARIFAETALTDLFRKVLRLVIKHQNRKRVVRLRNEYVEVDPRDWDTTMDVRVEVGLGTGVFEDKMALLGQIAQKQEQIVQLLGPGNPLVSLVQYRNTLAKIVEMAGFRNANEFFLPITNEDEQQAVAAMADAKKGDEGQQSPEAMLAQVEMKKIEAETALRQQEMQLKIQQQLMQKQNDDAELELKRREIELRDDRERDKAAAEIALKREEMQLKYQTQVREAELQAEIERTRLSTMQEPEGNA